MVVVCLVFGGCDALGLTTDVQVQSFDTVAAALDRDPDAAVLEFRNVVLRPDLAGIKTRGSSSVGRSSSGPRRTIVAAMIPLVDEGWTKDEPIAVWIRLDAAGKSLDAPALQKEIAALQDDAASGSLRVNATQTMPNEVDMDGTNAFTIGARRAMNEHGLQSPTGAVLATWPAKAKGRLRFVD